MTATELPETRTPRLRIYREQPAASRAMNALDDAVCDAGLEPRLADLIKLRASQINGCGYCIDMHSKDARRAGETEQRCTASSPGARRRTTRRASAPPWRSPKRSR